MQVPFVPSTPFHHFDTLKQMKSNTAYSTCHFNSYFVTVIASPKHILADFNTPKNISFKKSTRTNVMSSDKTVAKFIRSGNADME